jgi:tetratricopeptide (TPR) repeat protein
MEKERSIRVFISSTFVDNQTERDILVKKIFPQLRKICEERNVSWSEVDLRWGISEDKINEGKLIPVIIEEIRRCRPYFIGIVGNRYGYVPSGKDFSKEVLDNYPWLNDYPGRSITELEIIYGVFTNKERNIPAFFYLRSSGEGSLSKVKDDKYLKKLTALRDKIKKGYSWQEYSRPEQMGEMVLEDFRKYIDKEFPEGEKPDSYEVESRSQLSYARSRGSIYIGGDKYFNQIESFLHSADRLLIVDGISGSGKTSLLANWCLNTDQKEKELVIYSHFIGATENSTNWRQMLSRLIHYIGKYLALPVTVPDDADSLRSEFKKMLANINSKSGKNKIVFVIDALNQLEDREGAKELSWLPEMVNENVYFILSSLPGTSLELLTNLKHRTLTIMLLSSGEQKELIQKYFLQFSKILDQKYTEKILSNEQAKIPLYLLALLNEIRIFGKYEELGKRLDHYLKASSPLDLFIKVIYRLEKDYETEIKDLVRNAFCYIYASRKGVEEPELLELLSPDRKERLPIYYWSPFYLSVENSLVNHSGLINFSHDYLRKAVWNKYIVNEENEIIIHKIMAGYYLGKTGPINQRLADELPWHLIKSKQFKKLYELLTDPHFFNFLWKNNKYDLKSWIAYLEENSSYSVEKNVSFDIADFKLNLQFYFNLITLMYEMSKWEEVRKLTKPILNYLLVAKDWGNFGKLVTIVGQMMLDGEPEEVDRIMEWTKIAMAHSKEPKSNPIQINSLINLSYGYSDMGRNKIAIRYNNQALALASEIKDTEAIYTTYNNNAVIYNNMGKNDLAMELYNKVLQIGYDTGDQGAVQLAKGNLAWIYYGWGDLNTALGLFAENEKTYREWGDIEGQAFAKYCSAMILYEFDRVDEAESLYRQTLETYYSIKDYAWIPAVTGWLGLIAFEKGRKKEALSLLEKARKLYEKVPDYAYLPSFLADYAKVLIESGNFRRAKNMLKKAEKMARSVDYKSILIDVYIVKAYYWLKLKNYRNATITTNCLKKLSTDLKHMKGTIKCHIYEAEKSKAKSDFKKSKTELRVAEELAKSNGFQHIVKDIETLKVLN